MKYLYCFLLIIILSEACKQKTPESRVIEACGIKDPIHNLEWLKARVDEAKMNNTDEFLRVVLVTINGKQIINCQLEYMACLGCYAYNCDGSPFDTSQLNDAERTNFHQNLWGEKGNRVILWPQSKSR